MQFLYIYIYIYIYIFVLLPVRQLFPFVDELCSVGGLGHHIRRPHDLSGPVYHDDFIRVHSLLCPEVPYGDVPGPLASTSPPFYKGHAGHVVLVHCGRSLRVSLCR